MGKSRGRGRMGSRRGDEGANPLNALRKKTLAPQMREFIDYDYDDKLSQKDQEFLDRFTDEYYLSSSKPTLHNHEQTKENWAINRCARRDVTSRKQTIPDEGAEVGAYGGRRNS